MKPRDERSPKSAPAGAILFDGEVRDRELQKSEREGIRIQGFDVFLAGFGKALFSQSKFSPVYLTREAATTLLRTPPPWLDTARLRTVSANDPSELRELKRLILLSVGPEMIQLAWLRARLQRPRWPITAILHSLSPAPRIRYFFTSALLPMLGSHDAFVCPSEAAKRALEHVYRSIPAEIRGSEALPFELPVIPFGVDVAEHQSVDRASARRGRGFAPSTIVFCYLGRLALDKCDLLPLLLAFSRLPESSDALLVIAGDDTQFRMAPALANVAGELGLGERVRIMVNLSRTAKLELLAASDVFVSPTENTQESFPLTIAEAMASGLPVITSDWGAHGELVEHGATGFLVPTYMAPTAEPLHMLTLYAGTSQENLLAMSTAVDIDHLVRCLVLLLEHPELREAQAREARARVAAKLDWSTVMGQYDELWTELLEREKTPSRQAGPFECLSLQQVFADYPTRALRSDDRVMLDDGPGGRLGRRIPGLLSSSRHFQADAFRAVLELLEGNGPMRLGELAELVHQRFETGVSDVERHVGRMIKFGVLRLEQAVQGPHPKT